MFRFISDRVNTLWQKIYLPIFDGNISGLSNSKNEFIHSSLSHEYLPAGKENLRRAHRTCTRPGLVYEIIVSDAFSIDPIRAMGTASERWLFYKYQNIQTWVLKDMSWLKYPTHILWQFNLCWLNMQPSDSGQKVLSRHLCRVCSSSMQYDAEWELHMTISIIFLWLRVVNILSKRNKPCYYAYSVRLLGVFFIVSSQEQSLQQISVPFFLLFWSIWFDPGMNTLMSNI